MDSDNPVVPEVKLDVEIDESSVVEVKPQINIQESENVEKNEKNIDKKDEKVETIETVNTKEDKIKTSENIEKKEQKSSDNNDNKRNRKLTNITNKVQNESERYYSKKRIKEDKPPTKVVIRHLPPTMIKENFLEQVSPLPEIDYMYFCPADTSLAPYAFCRAYINFINQEDIFNFTRTFDGYVFLDSKGVEYSAIVEFAPFQRIPKIKNTKTKDIYTGTIDSDPLFIAFKENLLAEALESSKVVGNIKQHYLETEATETQEVTTTPLLEFVKIRHAEKVRLREERRQDRRRKEMETSNIRKHNKDEEDDDDILETREEKVEKFIESSSQQIQSPKFKKDTKQKYHDDRDRNRDRHVDRGKENKTKGGKSYREERLKLAEKRAEKQKLTQTSEERSEIADNKDSNQKDSVETKVGNKGGAKYSDNKDDWKRGKYGERNFVRRDFGRKDKEDRDRDSGRRGKRYSDYSSYDRRKSDRNDRKNIETKIEEKKLKKKTEKESDAYVKSNDKIKEDQDDNDDDKQRSDALDNESNSNNGNDRKDPRTGRRIRNKDRPAIEIYRPGMFRNRQKPDSYDKPDKNDETSSNSPSPTPNSEFVTNPLDK